MVATKQSKPILSTSLTADAYSAWLRGPAHSTQSSSTTSPHLSAPRKTPLLPPTFGKRASQLRPGLTNTNTLSIAFVLVGSLPKPQPAFPLAFQSPPRSLVDPPPSGKARRSNSPLPSINSSASPPQLSVQ